MVSPESSFLSQGSLFVGRLPACRHSHVNKNLETLSY
jgi:hypothetical protein